MTFDIFNADNVFLCNTAEDITYDILQQSRGSLYIKTLVPMIDVVTVWHPDMACIPPMRLPWNLEFDCGANKSYPMFVFMDKNSHAAYSIALTNSIDDCHCAAKMNQERCGYEVTFHIAITAKTEPFRIFSDNSHLPLQDILQRYRSILGDDLI